MKHIDDADRCAARKEARSENEQERTAKHRVGSCDICDSQNVELSHGYAAGIETFYCAEGCPKLINAEDMVNILREKCGDHGFCCPLMGMYPCEKNRRGCYCHELYLINEHDREKRARQAWLDAKDEYETVR